MLCRIHSRSTRSKKHERVASTRVTIDPPGIGRPDEELKAHRTRAVKRPGIEPPGLACRDRRLHGEPLTMGREGWTARGTRSKRPRPRAGEQMDLPKTTILPTDDAVLAAKLFGHLVFEEPVALLV